MTRAADLPDFKQPPVVEVALGVQFEPLIGMSSRHVGLLWERWRGDFPIWEDQQPLQTVKEWFGVSGRPSVNVRLNLGPLPTLRRAFFFDQERTELRQVQADRFVRNWRRIRQPYPRYDDDPSAPTPGLRTRFRTDLDEFLTFVRDQELGDFVPNQCEITYVNHVPTAGAGGAEHLSDLLAPWTGTYSGGVLGAAESVDIAMHFVLTVDGNCVGRLHVTAAPAHDIDSGESLTRLTLTARGVPLGKGVDGVMSFLDLGRGEIVRGFTSVTTLKMHAKWRRTDGG